MNEETVFYVVIGVFALIFGAMLVVGWFFELITVPFVLARQARHYAEHPRNVVWGALEGVLIVCWVLMGVIGAVTAASLVPTTGSGETEANLGAGLFLGFMALATLASFLTHRWFNRHYT